MLFLYLFTLQYIVRECANIIGNGNFEATYCNVRNAHFYRTRICILSTEKLGAKGRHKGN